MTGASRQSVPDDPPRRGTDLALALVCLFGRPGPQDTSTEEGLPSPLGVPTGVRNPYTVHKGSRPTGTRHVPRCTRCHLPHVFMTKLTCNLQTDYTRLQPRRGGFYAVVTTDVYSTLRGTPQVRQKHSLFTFRGVCTTHSTVNRSSVKPRTPVLTSTPPFYREVRPT